jgi:hypothetical protein
MLNTMHSIILNPPPHPSPFRSQILRTAYQFGSETFPPPSGSTNTAGQAFAHLSLGTSDTTLRTRYDHSRGHSSNHFLRRLDWQPRNARGTNSRSWRKNKDTRFNFAEARPERSAFDKCAAAPSCRSAHSSRRTHRNYFIYSQTESNHSREKSIIIERVFSRSRAPLLAVERDKH